MGRPAAHALHPAHRRRRPRGYSGSRTGPVYHPPLAHLYGLGHRLLDACIIAQRAARCLAAGETRDAELGARRERLVGRCVASVVRASGLRTNVALPLSPVSLAITSG